MTKNQVVVPSRNDIISTSDVNFVKCNFDAMFSNKMSRIEASPHTK